MSDNDLEIVEVTSEQSDEVGVDNALYDSDRVAQEAQESTAFAEGDTANAEEVKPEPAEETPEWFMKDKYKSIDEQAKSAYELQKKMGKFWGTPKDGYSLEDIEGIAENDPLLENLAPAIQELGLSQNGFKHLVQKYQEANIAMAKKMEEALKKELTTNDAANYRAVDQWMNENLSKQEKEIVQNNWLMTPQDFKLFNEMRLMMAPRTNVPSQQASQVKFESSDDVTNDKIKYKKEVMANMRVADKKYENELAQRFRDARQRELRNQ